MEFYIDISRGKQIKKEFGEIIKELKKQEKSLRKVADEVGKISGLEEMEQTIALLYEEVVSEKQSLEMLRDTYEECLQCYENTEKKLVSSESANWHMMLDIGGLVPGIGMVCDGVNAVWYGAEQDWENALLSGLSFIPAIGEVSGAGKVIAKVAGKADDIVDIVKAADDVGDAAKAAGKAKKAEKAGEIGKYVDGAIEGGTGIGNIAGKLDSNNIPNMTKQDIIDSIPDDWNYAEHNGFVHIRDADGNIRIRIDPPDKVTNYPHVHVYDSNGNLVDSAGNIVDRKSPDGHIPYKDN